MCAPPYAFVISKDVYMTVHVTETSQMLRQLLQSAACHCPRMYFPGGSRKSRFIE